jgi:hypothetical protein
MMNRRRFKRISNVIIDECVIHGVWLDADEMGAIARFVAEGGLARAEAQEALERRAGETQTIVIASQGNGPELFSGLPEAILSGFDEDGLGEIEQEVVIEHADGRIERHRRTLHPADADFESLFIDLFEDEL